MSILITGINGYISTCLDKWLANSFGAPTVKKLSLRNHYDGFEIPRGTEVVVHTAAIVHQKESKYTEEEYFDVNCSLTVQLAKKAKEAGVKQFVFLSTMAVFEPNIHDGRICSSTQLKPITMYGRSKLAAEKELQALADEDFTVSIVRPPMVYGPGCPGNYIQLSKLARLTPIFPHVKNERSMIFIDHLTEFIRQIIMNHDGGVFHPQDEEYICTTKMVKEIAHVHNRKIVVSKLLGTLLMKLFGRTRIVSKVFGNLTYSKDLSSYRDNTYQRLSFSETIKLTEIIKD